MDSYWGNLPGIPAISAVEVLSEKAHVIACFGDSITQQSTWIVPLEQMLNTSGFRAVVLNTGTGAISCSSVRRSLHFRTSVPPQYSDFSEMYWAQKVRLPYR